MTYAEKLRRDRNSIQYCYLQYNRIRQKKPQAFVAFLEGYDAPYYLPIIAMIIRKDPEQIICGNKKNVISMHDSLMSKGILNSAQTGFFIDRDFDNNESIKSKKDYFITKGYSVENYYCSIAAFERVLKSYMHYNCAHKDYDVLVNNYKLLQKEYNNAILEFNGWYCSLKHDKTYVEWCLEDKMPKGFVVMDLTQFSVKKNYTMSLIHRKYPATPQPLDQDVTKWSNWIKSDAVNNIRGKYEFEFLIAFLKSLSKIVNNSATAFEEHSMNFNLGQRDALSALAQYADRDEDLNDYIRKRTA